MQPQPKNDLVYLLTILEAAGKINIYRSGFTDAFDFYNANDQLYFNASLLLIATIGDHVAKINPATREKYLSIPWQQIKGMRNRIAHDYTGVDCEFIFEIVTNEVPRLTEDIEKLVRAELRTRLFSYEELEIAKNSTWYRHVNFANLF